MLLILPPLSPSEKLVAVQKRQQTGENDKEKD
jgi:hypothetical protein